MLGLPIRWKTPRRIFVNSMSDLFHETLPDEAIDQVFATMAQCPQHTFQTLTKRPERMLRYLNTNHGFDTRRRVQDVLDSRMERRLANELIDRWPLPNLWIGTSVENQKTSDLRIPMLLQAKAARRFISYEPALSEVDLTEYIRSGLDWQVCGGESGPSSRPFNVRWALDAVRQCRGTGCSIFIKQLGMRPYVDYYEAEPVLLGWALSKRYKIVQPDGTAWKGGGKPMAGARIEIKLKNKKGVDPTEWFDEIRVRQFPAPILQPAEALA